jgi:hypothetical protein
MNMSEPLAFEPWTVTLHLHMPVPIIEHRLSEAEYLKIERGADFKSEFFKGEMFAMAGGTAQHSLIATNLAREFGNAHKGRPGVAYNADL